MRKSVRHIRNFSLAAAALSLSACTSGLEGDEIPADGHDDIQQEEVVEASTPTPASCPVPDSVAGGRFYNERECFEIKEILDDDALMDMPVYQNLDIIRNIDGFGATVIERAIASGTRICNADLAPSVAGRYSGSENKISIDFEEAELIAKNLATMAHELWHSIQEDIDTENFYTTATLYENQQLVLSQEAAAEAFEVLIVFLAEQNGREGFIEGYSKFTNNRILMNAFIQAYDQNIADGALENEALLEATNAAYRTKFTIQSFLDHYNNNALRYTFNNVSLLKAPKGRNFSDDINKDGFLNDSFVFASYDDVPERSDLFGSNADLPEIFEAMEWYRQSIVFGEDDQRVIDLKDSIRASGNRFIDVDFSAVECSIRQGTLPEDAFRAQIDHSVTEEVTSLNSSAHQPLPVRPN